MKRVLSVLLVLVLVVGCLAGCKKDEGSTSTTGSADSSSTTTTTGDTATTEPAASAQGKVFNIYAWNEEFKGFFEKYYTVPEGVTVNWIINPSDGGVYQDKLDAALLAQSSASDDEKVDMFLAEADYITKYADSSLTQDITKIGVTDFSTQYAYTLDACSDANGVRKGVSFQCCPSALIYRRSIAKDMFGTDDPATVQDKLSDWSKFEAVAADAKAKGYFMTASFAETFRVFSNNCTSAWVDGSNNLVFDSQITKWIEQTKKFSDNGYTIPTAGIWDAEKNDQMYATGKTLCFFGPAWYFNFCMGNAMDPELGCSGDWAIIEGPQAHFWGGTWLLAATGSDNTEMIADIMNTFTNNEEVCSNLVKNENQYPNNTKVVEKFANDATYGNAFLGGQNDIAIFAGMTGNIKWENHTIYDQILNEGLQDALKGYFTGEFDYDTAIANYYNNINQKYPEIVTP